MVSYGYYNYIQNEYILKDAAHATNAIDTMSVNISVVKQQITSMNSSHTIKYLTGVW